MDPKETERHVLSRISELLLSLPFDLKVLQEAAADLDLERGARELAAGAILYVLALHETEHGPLRYADDVLVVRAAFQRVRELGGEGVGPFCARFTDIYDSLDEDVRLFQAELGDIWTWLAGKVGTFPRLIYKGKHASHYISDEPSLSLLYDEGLEFQTNYNVSEQQLSNKLRRSDQVVEILQRRRVDESKKAKKI